MLVLSLKNEGLGGVVVDGRVMSLYSDSGLRLWSALYTKPCDARKGAMRLVERLENESVIVRDSWFAYTLKPSTNQYPDSNQMPPRYMVDFDLSYMEMK